LIQSLRSDGDSNVSGKDVEDFLKAYDVNHVILFLYNYIG